jgi:hypothetical protein
MVFQIIREKFPEIYFQSMVKLALVHRVELGEPRVRQAAHGGGRSRPTRRACRH